MSKSSTYPKRLNYDDETTDLSTFHHFAIRPLMRFSDMLAETQHDELIPVLRSLIQAYDSLMEQAIDAIQKDVGRIVLNHGKTIYLDEMPTPKGACLIPGSKMLVGEETGTYSRKALFLIHERELNPAQER